MKGLSEGYKWAVDQNWGGMAKIGFFGPKTEILGPKKTTSFPCYGHDQKKLFKEKSWLFPNKYQSLKKFWVIFWHLKSCNSAELLFAPCPAFLARFS